MVKISVQPLTTVVPEVARTGRPVVFVMAVVPLVFAAVVAFRAAISPSLE